MTLYPRLVRRSIFMGFASIFAVGSAIGGERQFITRIVQSELLGEPQSEILKVCGPGCSGTEQNELGGLKSSPDKVAFSFIYGGKPSSQFLSSWKRTDVKQPAEKGKQRYEVTYTDPVTQLEIRCEATTFADCPAVEWVLHLHNGGAADTPILEDIRPLDLSLNSPEGKVIFHHAYGSDAVSTDFMPIDEALAADTTVALAPTGGRSSDGSLPFFNLDWTGGGLVGAIGWSGQWSLLLSRDKGNGLRLQAGQQTTHLKLHPGESIRTPSILLVAWEGADRYRGHNLLRRLLLAHYVPRLNGEIALPPVSQTDWFTFNSGNEVTEINQTESISAMASRGVEDYWLDAGWFEGGWPGGAGSWVPKPEAFPRGLRPIGEAAHRSGLKFILWFEPERVTAISRIAKEHPEWVVKSNSQPDGMFNLGEPAAREWLTGFLSQCVHDWGIDVYRNDFNFMPLSFWQAMDSADRKGIAEIRYIEGLYAFWDDMRARNPGLLIDNCASGGRRIDIETIRRSIPLWRDDVAGDTNAGPVLGQTQSAGLSLYVPLHAAAAWKVDTYAFRSVATTGVVFCMDTRAKDFPADQAKRRIEELKSLRPLYLGDYYPLTEINSDEDQWCAWQFNRPELGGGFAVFFRRARSPYISFVSSLHGLEAKAKYTVTFVDAKQTLIMSGAQLATLHVKIDSLETSSLIIYQKSSE